MLIGRRRTFSNSYKFVKGLMIGNRYIHDEYDKFTDYKKYAKIPLSKRNSRNDRIMYDNKIFNDKITDYK